MSFSYRADNARLEWDDKGLPRSRDYGDVYFNVGDPLGETRHVFLQGNHLPQRFARPENGRFRIAELGFGSGLNFLATCRLWCETAPADACLDYVSCELHPLATADMRRIHAHFPDLTDSSEALLSRYMDHTSGMQQLELVLGSHRITLTLFIGEAESMLAELHATPQLTIDAWYLDGFAPASNPALWSESLMQACARCSHVGSTFATYSVAGNIRRQLSAAGFDWEKTPGFGRKKHMLQGTLSSRPGQTRRASSAPERRVCIVGAGLAGCSTAHALATRGWQVTLVECADSPAPAASGNPQGILHFKPAQADIAANRFNLRAFLHALRRYNQLDLPPDTWSPCGMLQVAHDVRMRERFERIRQWQPYADDIIKVVDAGTAGKLAGRPLDAPAMYFPATGWLSPPALCRHYSSHPGIELLTGHHVGQIDHDRGGWEVVMHSSRGEHFLHVPHIVLCNAADVHAFPQTRHIPVIGNRGQVDTYRADSNTDVPLVLCGKGYITPALAGEQTVGGSFYTTIETPDRQALNRHWHLEQLAALDAGLADSLRERQPQSRRGAMRCTLADRMPVVGAVDAQHWPGLWINVGHASNGLARTPISAALLAALLDAGTPPLERELVELISPSRFPVG